VSRKGCDLRSPNKGRTYFNLRRVLSMETIEVAEHERPERPEFDALLKVAIALATQLKGKLIAWGEQMEQDQASRP
jgi:hypothetical protein